MYSMFRLEFYQGGGFSKVKVLSLKYKKKPKNCSKFGSCELEIRIRWLRYLDQILIAVEEIWLDSGAGVLNLSD